MTAREATFPRAESAQFSERIGAFTVLELLTVVAIIGIMAAILIPSLSSSRASADRTRTRVQFNQWAAAISDFRNEYGYYPIFHESNTVNGGADELNHPFHDVLAARKRDGSPLTIGSTSAIQNKKLITFAVFTEAVFTEPSSSSPNILRDAFGTTDIVLLVDRNLDGVINSTDFGAALPAVRGIRPNATDFPATDVRAGVIFYSPMPDATIEVPRFVCSWK